MYPSMNDHSGKYSTPFSEKQPNPITSVASIGTLPHQASSLQLAKTDSHAVLMELFARDQDLVRQATESARVKTEPKHTSGVLLAHSNQHPMKPPNSVDTGGEGFTSMNSVPTMNSWPHFSSITSLNNLGTIPGVKSITSLSGQDLASKGNVNKHGNLAQVKSIESMGRNDSYAFLEVFFGDKNSNSSNHLNSFGNSSRAGKGAGEEDNEIGLSLEDESPSQPLKKEFPTTVMSNNTPHTHVSQDQPESNEESGTLKRAYDDALAARGLMSVHRSCEKLTDLVLPAKMQKTLSQECFSKDQMKHEQSSFGNPYPFSSEPPPEPRSSPSQKTERLVPKCNMKTSEGSENDHVSVPLATKCAICSQTNVDTQLRPCGHMFHERCLKPSLQSPHGPPKCPIDGTPIDSAVLAVPTDDKKGAKEENPWAFGGTEVSVSGVQQS